MLCQNDSRDVMVLVKGKVRLFDIYFIECNKTIDMYKEKSPGLGHYVH
jgi:hypothetical protein